MSPGRLLKKTRMGSFPYAQEFIPSQGFVCILCCGGCIQGGHTLLLPYAVSTQVLRSLQGLTVTRRHRVEELRRERWEPLMCTPPDNCSPEGGGKDEDQGQSREKPPGLKTGIQKDQRSRPGEGEGCAACRVAFSLPLLAGWRGLQRRRLVGKKRTAEQMRALGLRCRHAFHMSEVRQEPPADRPLQCFAFIS